MKDKPIIELTRAETIEYINIGIAEWYQLFTDDYPANRNLVLYIFDESLTRSPRAKVREFWATLKNEFLEAEKTF
jgi:hypothetical protein